MQVRTLDGVYQKAHMMRMRFPLRYGREQKEESELKPYAENSPQMYSISIEYGCNSMEDIAAARCG